MRSRGFDGKSAFDFGGSSASWSFLDFLRGRREAGEAEQDLDLESPRLFATMPQPVASDGWKETEV